MPNTQNDDKAKQLLQCRCVVLNRHDDESQREWLKRIMCQFHWMQTDYYQAKLELHRRNWSVE